MTSARVKKIAAGVVGTERSSPARIIGALEMSNGQVNSSAATSLVARVGAEAVGDN
jgi:hypothetical protein